MRVLVCGSRSWDRPAAIGSRLSLLPRGSEIVHGGARGVDSIAGQYARALGMHETVFPADWEGKGKNAGRVRNEAMLDTKPKLVIAFWDGMSRGTKHCIDAAQRRGIDVEIILRSDQR